MKKIDWKTINWKSPKALIVLALLLLPEIIVLLIFAWTAIAGLS